MWSCITEDTLLRNKSLKCFLYSAALKGGQMLMEGSQSFIEMFTPSYWLDSTMFFWKWVVYLFCFSYLSFHVVSVVIWHDSFFCCCSLFLGVHLHDIKSAAPYSFFDALYSFCLVASRGPWGSLSPIPESNAIAVDNQVCSILPLPMNHTGYLHWQRSIFWESYELNFCGFIPLALISNSIKNTEKIGHFSGFCSLVWFYMKNRKFACGHDWVWFPKHQPYDWLKYWTLEL